MKQFLRRNAFILATVIAGLILRLLYLQRAYTGIDEDYTIRLIARPAGEIMATVLLDNHPPLYYMLAKAAFLVSGELFYVRLLSVAAGIGAIIFTYLLVKKAVNRECAVVASFLMAVNPILIAYSQHLRNYMLFAFLFIASVYFFRLYLDEGRKRHLAAVAVLNTLLLYTHYHGIAVLFAFFAFIAAAGLLWKERIKVKEALIAVVVPAVLFLPMAGVILTRAGTVSEDFGAASAWNIFYFFYKYFAGANVSFLLHGNAVLLAVFPLCLLLFAAGITGMWRNRNRLMLFFLAVPFATSFAVAVVFPLFFYYRYLIYLSPFLMAAVAFALTSMKNRKLSAALLLALTGLWLAITLLYYGLTGTPDWGIFFGL
jgi:4-amino-4-deoxy-L-arabinose transferase-like glycosyltransferase